MRRKLMLSFVLLLSLSVLASCNGARETDQIAYVLAVGADVGPEGMLKITYQIAVPRSLAGTEARGGGDQKSSVIVTFTAPSLVEARNLLSSTVARAPNLSHAKAFIIGEELARKGLRNFMGPLMRYREFRGSMFIMVARGTAEEFMRKNHPDLESVPSRYYESMLLITTESAYNIRSDLHTFYSRLKSSSGEPYATLVGISPRSGKSSGSGSLVPPEKAREYLAGDIPAKGGNAAEIIGTAVFKKDKMVGMLTNEETRMLNILRGDFPQGFFVVTDPLEPGSFIHVNLRLGRKPKINVNLVDGRPIININILLEGEPTSIASGINYELDGYRQQLETYLSDMIRQQMLKTLLYTQSVDADIFNFGRYLWPKFATYDEFRNVHWDEKYPQAEFNIKITVKLRRSGLMWRTSPIRMDE